MLFTSKNYLSQFARNDLFYCRCLLYCTADKNISSMTNRPTRGKMEWIIPLIVVSALTFVCLILLIAVLVYWRWAFLNNFNYIMVNVFVNLFPLGYFLFCHEKKKTFDNQLFISSSTILCHENDAGERHALCMWRTPISRNSEEVLHYLRPWTSDSRSCLLDLLDFSFHHYWVTVSGLQELGLNSMGEHKDGEKIILMLHLVEIRWMVQGIWDHCELC